MFYLQSVDNQAPKKENLIGSLYVFQVIRLGFEPKTPTLKV